jgi:ABC-2 type transport system ATP-binding protein
VIELLEVTKVYRSPLGRTVRAVEGLSLRVDAGEVVGLAGPNGAGKSTLMNLVLGYLRPTRGEVRVGGHPPREYVERHGIGYLPEVVAIPPAWTVETALTRYALLAGLAPSEIPSRREGVITMLGLEPHRQKTVRRLSKGTLQRLGLAQALIGHTDLIVLDEPTQGLDPVWIARFRDLVRELRSPTRAILIASHQLDELERIADRVAIIDRGRLQCVVDVGGASGATDGGPVRYRLTVVRGAEHVRETFPEAIPLDRGVFELPGATLDTLNTGVAMLIQRGGRIAALEPAASALERSFQQAVGGSAP